MTLQFLHEHREFDSLIQIISEKNGIPSVLVEKDYWIMHCLYGLKKEERAFYLKGGTSLSKGYKIINRFSEDIDILIEPPAQINVPIGKNQNKPTHCEERRKYYDWLSQNIQIEGILNIERDTVFDDDKYRSGGIRLYYPTTLEMNIDVKNGILLEVGFDKVSPHKNLTISSWAYDEGATKINVKDNRAVDIPCYLPGYTFVEKLQTISTKFRKQQKEGGFPLNFIRHYYDIYNLLNCSEVLDFIGTEEYLIHKKERFRAEDIQNLTENEAFQMKKAEIFNEYQQQYQKSQTLYYGDKPEFSEIMDKIREMSGKL